FTAWPPGSLPSLETPTFMKQRILALLALTLLCLAGPVRADDWPEFRGPTGQGLVKDAKLPIEWNTTKNVVWKQSIPGRGWSSPVMVAGRIYLTTAVTEQADDKKVLSLQALCLDAKTGKLLWQREVFRQDSAKAPGIHRKNSHASPTPLIHDKKMYVHFGHQ